MSDRPDEMTLEEAVGSTPTATRNLQPPKVQFSVQEMLDNLQHDQSPGNLRALQEEINRTGDPSGVLREEQRRLLSQGLPPDRPDEMSLEDATKGLSTHELGNIDLNSRPVLKNSDGSFSTEQSFSMNFDGKEVLLPRVSPTGRLMSQEEAVQEYLRTGKHLGKFNTPEEASAYAQGLHKRQEKFYDPETGKPLQPSNTGPLFDYREKLQDFRVGLGGGDEQPIGVEGYSTGVAGPTISGYKPQGPGWLDKYPMLKLLNDRPDLLLGGSWMNPGQALNPESFLSPMSAMAGAGEFAVAGLFDTVLPGLLAFDAAGAAGAAKATDLYEQIFHGYSSTGGVDFVDTFNKEFAQKMEKVQSLIPYMPETAVGQAAYQKAGELFMQAVSAAGDATYKLSGEPLAAAAAETTAALVALALGEKLARYKRSSPEKPYVPGDVWADADAKSPVQNLNGALDMGDWSQTMNALDAMGVGRISMEPQRTPRETANALLDRKLGLDPEQSAQYTLRDKYLMMLEQVDAQQTMTTGYKLDLAEVFDVQLDALTKLWETIPETYPQSKLDRVNAGTIEVPVREPSAKPIPFRYRRITAPDAWSLDLEQPVASALRPLGEVFRKEAGALFVDRDLALEQSMAEPSDLRGPVKVFRGVAAGGAIRPGDWVTDNFQVAADYANQRGGGTVQPGEITAGRGRVLEQELRGEDLIKVHPNGYIYAPLGVDLSGVIRYVDSGGNKITFGDMAGGNSPEPKLGDLRVAGKQRGAVGPRPPVADQSKLSKMRRLQDLSTEALRESERLTARKVVKAFRNQVADASGELKAKLLDENSLAGQRAVNNFNIINGAGAKAQARYKSAVKNIYGDLNRTETKNLDLLIDSRRKIQIDDYKGEGKTKRAGGLVASDYRDGLLALRDEIGQQAFDKLQDRANRYFGVYKQLLAEQLDAGMISDEQYKKLSRFEYSPTQYLDLIDPESLDGGHKPGVVNVRESGVEWLKGGADVINNMNGKELLAEHIGRLERRLAKNKANTALAEFARAEPSNEIVREATVVRDDKGNISEVRNPDRWTQISFFEGGKRKVLLMRPDLADQWKATPYEMGPLTANVFRALSGQTILKPLATTYNPSFVLAGLPMDLAHTWLASGDYATFLPQALGEMSADLGVVLKDAITRGKRFQDYVNEGGGFNFLTHQGSDLFSTRKGLHEQMDPKWGRVKSALSYFNETAEIAVRLAHRERLLKNGATPEEASAAARDRLDYSQGGPLIKAGDTVIPYLNVAVHGYAKVARQAKKDPVAFAAKTAQLLTAAYAVNLMNATQNPEAWNQVPPNDKVNNFVITTPYFVLDPEGNKRYLYFKLRTDAVAAPILAIAAAGTDAFVSKGNAPPSDLLRKTMATMPGAMPPSIAAWASYTSNYDFWADKEIWSGARVSPEMEFNALGRGEPTPEILKWIGQAGLSPERLDVALRNLVPNNDYVQLLGAGWKAITGEMSDYEKSMSTEQLLTRSPGLRRVVSLTHPAVAEMENLVANEQRVNDQHKKESDTLSELSWKVRHGQLQESAVHAWIENQPGERKADLHQLYQSQKVLDRVYRDGSVPEGMPSKSWWTRSAKLAPEARASAWVERYSDADSTNRERMKSLAARLPGYGGDEFERYKTQYLRAKGLH